MSPADAPRRPRAAALLCAAALLPAAPAGADAPAAPARPTGAALAAACQGREGWSDPAPPAHVFGNTYYVGTCGITVLLVTSAQGHVLLDGGTVGAAPLVQASIERLGFRLRDVKWIVSSHEHHDHIGPLAALKRLTGAKVAALAEARPALESGGPRPDDPQFAIAERAEPVKVDRVLADRGVVALGPLRLTVRSTPAHSPGSASWTWRSCERNLCRTMTYADSATVISADSYRFADHPDRVAAARIGLERIAALPCGVLITPHPSASNLFARLAGQAPLDDPQACRAYADGAKARMAARLAKEGPAAK